MKDIIHDIPKELEDERKKKIKKILEEEAKIQPNFDSESERSRVADKILEALGKTIKLPNGKILRPTKYKD